MRLLHAFGGLDRIHLLLEALDIALGLGHGLAQLRHAGGETFGLLTFAGLLDFQVGDLLGDFLGQGFVASVQRLQRVLFVLGNARRALVHLVAGQLLLGHDLGQRFLGLAQLDIGVTDFLIEDAQGLAIDHRLTHFIGAATQRRQHFAPDIHRLLSSQALVLRKPS